MTAVFRATLVGGLCCGLALLVYWRVSANQLDRALQEMAALQEEMEQRLAAKEAMIQRLNRSRRLAHLHVLDQRADPEGEILETGLLFVELDDAGRELARQQFMLPGEVVFVDAWSVKFHHTDVAEGHPLRAGRVYELTVDAVGGMSLLPLAADDLAHSTQP
jgi:hypothetical protein